MHDEPLNRMANPAKRGRPPKYGVDGNPPQPSGFPQPVEEVALEQPPVTGIRCPSCARGMVPRRDSVQDRKCYAHCSLCGVRMVLTFSHNRYLTARVLRGTSTE